VVTPEEMLELPAIRQSRCRGKTCTAMIRFVRHPNTGNTMPIDIEGEHAGLAHHINCPDSKSFRRSDQMRNPR